MMRLITFLLLLSFSLASQATTITAKTDRNPVGMNESFTLTFMADGSVDDDPDFTPLKKDFDILGQSSGSNISIINGSYSRTTTWILTMMAKQQGTFTIPSIAFGSDRSPAMRISVNAASSAPSGNSEVFMELESSTRKAWVQSQIVLTERLYSAANISHYGLSQLQIKDLDTVAEQLGKESQYQTTRGNQTYLVIERKYALYPQKAGALHIPAQVGEVQMSSGRGSFFDPFPGAGKTQRVRSRSLDIQVQPAPASFQGKNWLPSSEVQLVEEWSPNPPVFKVGEPVTRSISLFADGITAAQLPTLQNYNLPGIKTYPDQPTLKDNKQSDGIIGGRTEKVALMPTQAGNYTLPEIDIPWFNTKTGKTEVAKIAARTIKVLPGAVTTNAPPQVSTPVMPQTSAMPAPAATATAPPSPEPASSYWPWISLALGAGWLITLLAWWFKRGKSRPVDSTLEVTAPSLKKLTTAVYRSCKLNQASSCKDALIEWGRARYPAQSINSLGDLAQHCNARLGDAIKQLNNALYGNNATHWNSQSLVEAFKAQQKSAGRKPAEKPSSLQPLYPDTRTP